MNENHRLWNHPRKVKRKGDVLHGKGMRFRRIYTEKKTRNVF